MTIMGGSSVLLMIIIMVMVKAFVFLLAVEHVSAFMTTSTTTSSLRGHRQRLVLLFSQTENNDNENKDDDDLKMLICLLQETGLDPQELLRTRLLSLSNDDDAKLFDYTTVLPSAIAGRGLFATQNRRKGQFLTCYPGDGLVIQSDVKTKTFDVTWGNHVKNADKKTLTDEIMAYVIHCHDDYGLVGLADLDHDPSYLGHFANDGAAFVPMTIEEVSPYVIESLEKANAMHRFLNQGHMVTVATRDIQKGEEIFVSYGPDYWMEANNIVYDDGDDDEIDFYYDDEEANDEDYDYENDEIFI